MRKPKGNQFRGDVMSVTMLVMPSKEFGGGLYIGYFASYHIELDVSWSSFACFKICFPFLALKVVVFWVFAPHSEVVGYYLFGGPCFHLHGPPKRWYPTTSLHNVRNQNLDLHCCENFKSLTFKFWTV
jgi:hypothetical protein